MLLHEKLSVVEAKQISIFTNRLKTKKAVISHLKFFLKLDTHLFLGHQSHRLESW